VRVALGHVEILRDAQLAGDDRRMTRHAARVGHERGRAACAPRTLRKLSFMPANDADAVSSAVADDRTATGASSPPLSSA
jgi:hypothetical protein